MDVRILYSGLSERFVIFPGLISETGQAVVRLFATVLFGLYLSLFGRAIGGIVEFKGAAIVCGVYATFAALWIFAVRKTVFSPKVRRIVTPVLDQLMFGIALFFGGKILAPFMFVPICMAIGTGLRFGRQYALLSTLLGMPFVFTALVLSPFWKNYPLTVLGIVLSMLVIPYCCRQPEIDPDADVGRTDLQCQNADDSNRLQGMSLGQ